MIKTSIKGVKELQNELKKIMESLDGPMVTVGFHEDGTQPPEGEDNMATIAARHEFGDGVPERPFLQVGVDSGIEDYRIIMEDGINDAVTEGKDITLTLRQVGVFAVGKVQEFITDLKSPANSPSTIAAKGSANPLIDTGIMRSSVNFKLQLEKPEEGI